MRKLGVANVLGLLLLSLVLAACGGYTEVGGKSTSHQGATGGDLSAAISKANGAIEKDIEAADSADLVMDVDVTLAVGKGSYKIELLGQDKEVTLSLRAHDGQTVTGHGQMVTDAFGTASYRVTAEDAENVDYVLEYTFR
jgi:hypothetical protein